MIKWKPDPKMQVDLNATVNGFEVAAHGTKGDLSFEIDSTSNAVKAPSISVSGRNFKTVDEITKFCNAIIANSPLSKPKPKPRKKALKGKKAAKAKIEP